MSWNSRKFLYAVGGMTAVVTLEYLKLLTATGAGAIVALVSAYLAANVTQKAVTDAK